MDTFFTWEYLLSFAGCVAGTGILTQFLKPITRKVPTQLVSYVVALLIMTVGQIATHTLKTWDMVALNLINAVVISLTSNGGFDAIKRAFGAKTDEETELTDEDDE